jgi:cobalt-zinc-cadmium efflux system outer membrane protein
VVQDLLHVLMLPERRRIAEHRLASTKRSVAASIVEFAADVERAYYEALGAAQAASVRRLVVDAASTSAELARRLHEAGNISDLALATELGLYEGVRVAWARTESARAVARDELNRLLGLWGPAAAWTLPTGLPDLPAEEPRLGPVEAEAIANRLDLEAAIAESQAIAREAGVTRAWSFLPAVEFGASAEREPDGSWVLGPELGLELPIFDRGQADLVRLDAELRRADQRVFGLAVEIRSEARAARDRLLEARWLVEHYRDVLIPVREATVAALQEEHAFMLAGTFELIAAKQAEYDAYQEYVEAVRDYWLARVRLDRALGGRARETSHPQASDPLPIAPTRRDAHPNHEHGGHRDAEP